MNLFDFLTTALFSIMLTCCDGLSDSSCLCPANYHALCGDETDGGPCKQCVYFLGILVDDHDRGCWFDVDISTEAKAIKQVLVDPQVFHHLFWEGTWRCLGTNSTNPNSNQMQHCDGKDTKSAFLTSFPRGKVGTCNLFNGRLNFWHCKEAGRCIREGYTCAVKRVKTQRYCPHGQVLERSVAEGSKSICVQKICPVGQWPCNDRCISMTEPCETWCDENYKLCPGPNGGAPKCVTKSENCTIKGSLEPKFQFSDKHPNSLSLETIIIITSALVIAVLLLLILIGIPIIILSRRKKRQGEKVSEDEGQSGMKLATRNEYYCDYGENKKEEYETVDPSYHYY